MSVHDGGPTTTPFTLQTWLEAWTKGVDLQSELFEYETVMLMDPFTKTETKSTRQVRAKGRRVFPWWLLWRFAGGG